METKQNTNDLSLGMTNIPSDTICPDNSVAAEWNMIFRDGEHRPIQAPRNLEIFKTGSFYILHIHKVSKVKHYVGVNDNWNLVYCTEGGDTITIGSYADYDEETQVTSIGNTLIVNVKGKELRYFLWKPDSMTYKFIGNKLPKPEIKFVLANEIRQNTSIGTAKTSLHVHHAETAKYDGILSYNCPVLPTNNKRYCVARYEDEKEEDAKSLFIGLYSKCKKKAAEYKQFCNPFFVRYALKMFDGNYTIYSTPTLLMPTVRGNHVFSIDTPKDGGKLICTIDAYPLYFHYDQDMSEWNDIIKDISVFITNPVDVHDTSVLTEYAPVKQDSITSNFSNVTEGFTPYGMTYSEISYDDTNSNNNVLRNAFKVKSDTQITSELTESSVFYKLFSINLKGTGKWEETNKYIKDHDLENITTAEQLDHDDYFSNCPLTAESIYMYNKRLHLSNVSRGFYKGGTSFLPLHTIEYTIIDRVQINTPEGVKVVLNKYKTRENPSIYFYYPDPRAFHVDRCVEVSAEWLGIIHVGQKQCSFDLKTHPLLNGAYYMRDTLPGSDDNLDWTHEQDIPYTRIIEESFYQESVKPENLSNEVWVSEVNNPFVFNAQGVNTVGNGTIIGVVSNTRAISQGQFGKFPLFCFTSDGIWMLQTSSEGIYSASSPISREVCNNKNSITATDNLVFFTSEKGLMMINGADVSCVSSQLSGKTYDPTQQEISLYLDANIEPDISFLNFIRKCKIAYDYRDNLLWITNPDYPQCFVLSIESGTFALSTLSYPVANVVNDYPDNIILCHDTDENYYPYSLIDRENINDDPRRINSFIITRPMKIGDQNALKCPTMLRYIGKNNQQAVIKLQLFASDDLENWVKVLSVRGRGFKYYKYNIIFENLLPTDSFSGIAERWQFKYLSKLR